MKKKLILASSSPRRKELLEKAGVKFEIATSDYEEDMTLALPPRELAMHLAIGKAQAVANSERHAVIMGADTFICLDNLVLGKPKTVSRAREMLRSMSGRAHTIITGYAILDSDSGKTITGTEHTEVFFRRLSNEDIEHYLAVSSALDRAGAYAIQDEESALIIDRFEGDFSNAMGLPVGPILEALKQYGVL